MSLAAADRVSDFLDEQRRDRIASFLSFWLSPPLTALYSAAIIGALFRGAQWQSALLLYVGLAIAAPLFFLFWLRNNGYVSDLDISRRRERFWPFAAALLGVGSAALVLHLADGPFYLARFAFAHAVVMAVLGVITFFWKISVHCASAAAVSVILAGSVGASAFVASLPLVLVGWARVYLRRHTLAQTLAGGALGLFIFTQALW